MFEKIFDIIIPIAGGIISIVYSFSLSKKGLNKKSKTLLIAGIVLIVLSIIYLIFNFASN